MVLGISVTGARRALVWGAATVVAAMLEAGLVPVLGEATTAARGGSLATTPFDDALVWSSAAVAAVVTAWLWLVTTVVTADALRGRRRRRRGVPEGLRRVVLVLGGAALTSGLAAPALAGGEAPGADVLAGLRLPERVGVAPPAVATPGSWPGAGPPAHVVVASGDSLWSITAGRLGPATTADEIAHAWPRLYAANREVIGPDPAVIEPGQRLVLPPLLTEGDGRVVG